MKKRTSEAAYYERMRTLANPNKDSIRESNNRTAGTLIDYKRAADGVAYGIIKENHNYYIKKSGLKQDPNISDFAYIGGLENITEFQYKSLGEADKQRNMMFHTINEANTFKPSLTGSKKKKLNEDKASDEIDKAESKLDDLDAASDAADATPAMPTGDLGNTVGDDEMAAADDEMSAEGDDEMAADDEMDAASDDEMAADDEMDAEGDNGDDDEVLSDMQSKVGKLASEIKNSNLDGSELTWLLKTFVKGFLPNKDEDENSNANKMAKIDDDDRHEISDMILNVVSPEEIQDLGQNVEDTAGTEDTNNDNGLEEECSECGGFARYAESRGYTPESLMECGEEEMGNLIGGYATAHSEGQNDGDKEVVSLFIKLMPQVLDILRNEYGHEEYADELEPEVNSMDESTEEDVKTQISELFGGLNYLGKKASNAVGGAIKNGANALGRTAQNAYNSGVEKAGQVKHAVGQAAQNIKQGYYAGEKNAAIQKLQTLASDLGKQVAAVNANAVKAGQEPVNVQSILQTIANQVKNGNAANLNKFRTAESMDPANVETQPIEEITIPEPKTGKKLGTNVPVKSIKEEEEFEDDENVELGDGNEEENDEINFAPEGQSMGGGVVKPNGAPTTGIDINVDGENKTINIAVNEVVNKLREALDEISTKLTTKAKVEEKWDGNVKINKTGENSKKSVGQIDKELSGIEKKSSAIQNKGEKVPEDMKKKEHQLNFAKRAKNHWNEGKEMSKGEAKAKVEEKWDSNVKINKTGENSKKSVGQIDKELSGIEKKSKAIQDRGEKVPEDIKKKEHQLNFAKRAKNHWNEGKEMSEGEAKLRKYIRNRLEEHAGLRKPVLTESKKSENLKKLDAIIDKQYNLYETVIRKKIN